MAAAALALALGVVLSFMTVMASGILLAVLSIAGIRFDQQCNFINFLVLVCAASPDRPDGPNRATCWCADCHKVQCPFKPALLSTNMSKI